MKRIAAYILAAMLLCGITGFAAAQETSNDIAHIFSKANALYEKRDYENALEEYKKILDQGVESGPIYYNIANTYFKLGKTGYAILFYRKAARLMPADSDLKSNLSYAQSLTDDSALQSAAQSRFAWLVKIPFKEFTLNGVARILVTLYLLLVALIIAGKVNHVFRRRVTFIFYPILIMFLLALTGFSVRYYEEEALTHGAVVAGSAECKYEPIDKSTTYFTLKDGQEVLVLKSRNGWSRIKRLDGKLGWVKSDSLEEE